MTAVDWSRFRKCPACFAELGAPCKSLDGLLVNGQVTEIQLNTKDRPHGGRRLRTGGALMPKSIREITMAEIEGQFEVASAGYWFGEKWCPAVYRNGNGYGIRVVKSTTQSGANLSVTYDSFDLDAEGVVLIAPRGYAKDFKPGRVVDVGDAADRMLAAPDHNAMRIGL